MTREFIRVSFSVSLCACIQNINTNPILFVINQRLMIMADKYVQLWFPLSMIYRSYVHNEKKRNIYIYKYYYYHKYNDYYYHYYYYYY